MDYSQQLALSYYKTIATLNELHNIFLVQHQDTNKIYVKKIIDIYNIDVYRELATHPIYGIPKIKEYFEINNQLIVIENYVSGTSLADLINNNTLTLTTLTGYVIELCNILNQLHQLTPPIVHRDIKPSNLLITEYNHVILIDFNAAKYYSDTASNDTILLGTKGYAAPEQFGFGSSSPQTDIYAVGILIKEMASHINMVPKKLLDISEKCTRINPAERYDNVLNLSKDIQHVCNSKKNKKSEFTASQLLPPGFRTHTAWKMLISIPTYFVVLWLSLSLVVKNTYGLELWIQRFFCLFMFLSIIGGTCNYLNIQKYFPLCRHKYKIVRFIGIILLDIMLIATLFIIMMIVLSIVSPV